jgi:hypothetical protein
MTESRIYSIQLEKKLIDEFKEKFIDKIGYEPTVITKVENNEYYIPMMSLEQLAGYFEPFLPTLYEKKLTLDSKSRKRELVELRMMFCYIARTMNYKLTTIGDFIGGRDHTTIIHNVTTFLNLIETSELFRFQFLEILNYIKENHESPTLDKFNQTQREPELALLS